MKIINTSLKDCFIIEPCVFKDNRGFFFESFNKEKFKQETGVLADFIQDNLAYSSQNVIRGLHFQEEKFAQAKLVSCIKGKILDVAVDIRPESKTFGQHFAIELSHTNNLQLYVPRGFAHGYSVLSKEAHVQYKVDNIYAPQAEQGIIYHDSILNIDWKVKTPILSEKDLILPTFNDYFKQ
ncbi:MAG: dTDP-4-dehydrorhamnose 3,5-epimerase [Flavobacteriales bacterium]